MLLLAVLVSSQLRAVGPRHASGTRQLPSKPCRPRCYRFHFSTLDSQISWAEDSFVDHTSPAVEPTRPWPEERADCPVRLKFTEIVVFAASVGARHVPSASLPFLFPLEGNSQNPLRFPCSLFPRLYPRSEFSAPETNARRDLFVLRR